MSYHRYLFIYLPANIDLMSFKGKSKKKFLTAVLTGIFVIALLNNSFNRHNHVVSGFLYSHAHPFGKTSQDSPVKSGSHNHTLLELFLLELLSDQGFLEIALFSIAAAYGTLLFIGIVYQDIHIATRIYSRLVPRAPPA